MTQKVDKSIPRVMYMHDDIQPPRACPQCKTALIQERGPYEVMTLKGRRVADSFAVAGSVGYLCPNCATVVIHTPKLQSMLELTLNRPKWDVGNVFIVTGIYDLDAVPPDQQHLSLTDVVPSPFAPFQSAEPIQLPPARKRRPRKPKPRRK